MSPLFNGNLGAKMPREIIRQAKQVKVLGTFTSHLRLFLLPPVQINATIFVQYIVCLCDDVPSRTLSLLVLSFESGSGIIIVATSDYRRLFAIIINSTIGKLESVIDIRQKNLVSRNLVGHNFCS